MEIKTKRRVQEIMGQDGRQEQEEGKIEKE
jgi:hypothetical protein